MVPLVLIAQTTPDGEVGEMQGFARALDISEGNVFIGEPSNFHQPGAVYVFASSGSDWSQKARLIASDGTIGDRFGSSVSAEGSRLVIGAPSANSGNGAAYVFELSASGEWTQVSHIAIPDDTAGSRVGASVLVNGDHAYIGAPNHNDGLGSVLVYTRSGNADWSQTGVIANPDTSTSSFGTNLALDGNSLVVSAPDRDGGVVFVYNREGDEWMYEATLSSDNLMQRSMFGTSLAVQGDQILVGAPRNVFATGTVFVFEKEDGEWEETGSLSAFDGQTRYMFGSSIEVVGSEVWIGAPNANSGKGTIYQFHADEDGMWSASKKMAMADQESGDSFSSTVAVEGDVAVVGLTGADYGAGTAAILKKTSSGEWATQKVIIGEGGEGLQPITGGRVDCQDAKADQFGCDNVDLISFLPISDMGGGRGVRLNDIWGWTDPITGKEYALVGRNEGTSFVDVSDPANPIYIGNLQMTEGSRANVWRDIKTYQNHAYIVADGAGEHGMQVLDLTQLRDFTGDPIEFEATAMYTNIHSAHNVVINEDTGYAYIVGSSGGGMTCGGGLHMVNIQDPANPTFEGCFSDPSTGRSGTGYSHDAQCVVYNGPDTEHQGSEICFGANETAVSIADVTDKKNPVALSTASYPNYGYVHQGWLTEDHKYFFQNDELDELMGSVETTRTMVWDVTDLDDPQLVTEFFIDIPSSDHNLYIRGNKMYQSNYVSGLQVIDVADPANPRKVGEFDTDPFSDTNPGFSGTWSNYPFFESGMVIMTSGREGMFVLEANDEAINQ
jgi:choice-of-anchor B domain-containing protein